MPDIGGLDFYVDAFLELSTSRQIGMSVGPIPFTAIAEYYRVYNLGDGGEDFFEFVSQIRRLDSVYLELREEHSKKESRRLKSSDGTKKTGRR